MLGETVKNGILRSSEGKSLSLRLARHGGALLIECPEAQSFVRHLFPESRNVRVPPDSFARAVFDQDGGYVQLFDRFGPITSELRPLTAEEVDARFRACLITEASVQLDGSDERPPAGSGASSGTASFPPLRSLK